MKVAIEVSPLEGARSASHKVRGTGFYIENLRNSLIKYCPHNKYIFFTGGRNFPNDASVVHYPYFEPFFLTLPFRHPQKTVVTVHDLTPLVFPKNFPAGMKGKLRWQVQKKLLAKADAIITDSNSSKKDIIRFTGIPDHKITVIYLAAAEEFGAARKLTKELEQVRDKYHLPKQFVLYVGDGTWNKNLPRLLEAVEKLNAPLVMVGKALINEDIDKNNPWNRDLVEVQKTVKENKQIMCTGFVPTEELISIYQLATVLAMPSLYEGFGLPILEAMSSGCPVVTSASGSLSEVAGDAAVYVDPNSVQNIADGIIKVYHDQSLQKKLQQQGFKQANKFSWEKTALQTEKVYKEVII